MRREQTESRAEYRRRAHVRGHYCGRNEWSRRSSSLQKKLLAISKHKNRSVSKVIRFWRRKVNTISHRHQASDCAINMAQMFATLNVLQETTFGAKNQHPSVMSVACCLRNQFHHCRSSDIQQIFDKRRVNKSSVALAFITYCVTCVL